MFFQNLKVRWVARLGYRSFLALTFLAPAALLASEHADEEPGWDGLVAIEASNVAAAYIDKAADFSVFNRVSILEPYVAFRGTQQPGDQPG